MAIDLETGLLRAFVVCVRAGSISRGAAVLGRTQPALSQQLRKLERAVGQSLLLRTPTGIAPTRAGEALLPYADRILSLSAQALAESGQTVGGHCGIGLIEDLASDSMPQALADFALLHPAATLEIMILPGPAMREAFADGRVQIALCDTAYLSEPASWTTRMPLVWAVGAGFDETRDPLPLALFSEPCRWRAPVLETLRRSGRRWRIAFESTGLTGIQAAVRANLGAAALMPVNLGAGLSISALLPPLPDVEIGLVRRPDTDGNPLVDAVEALLRRLV